MSITAEHPIRELALEQMPHIEHRDVPASLPEGYEETIVFEQLSEKEQLLLNVIGEIALLASLPGYEHSEELNVLEIERQLLAGEADIES